MGTEQIKQQHFTTKQLRECTEHDIFQLVELVLTPKWPWWPATRDTAPTNSPLSCRSVTERDLLTNTPSVGKQKPNNMPTSRGVLLRAGSSGCQPWKVVEDSCSWSSAASTLRGAFSAAASTAERDPERHETESDEGQEEDPEVKGAQR